MSAATHDTTDALRRLLGRGSIYTLGTAVQMSTALLVLPIVTRLLDASAYGAVAAALVVMTILSMVAALGLPDASAREYFQGPGGPVDARRLVASTIGFAAAFALVAEASGPLWAQLFSLDYSGVLRAAVIGGAAGAVVMATQALLRAEDRVWAYLVVLAVGSVGAQALGLGLTAALGSPAAYVAGLAAGAIVAAALGLTLTGSLRHGLPRRDGLRSALSIGLPLIPHSLAVYLVASADRVAIAGMLGLAAAGRYQVAYAVGSLGVALATALNQAWLPLLLRTEEERRWRVLASTSVHVHRIAIVVAGGIALLAPVGLALAAPPSFGRDALVPVSAIVAFGVLPYVTSSTFFHGVFLLGRTRAMAVAAPLAAAANVALNVALLPAIGLLGAALATAAAYAVLAAVAIRAARRHGVELDGALGSAAAAWALGAPLVAAGALLPLSAGGIALRVLAALALAAYAVRSSGARTRRPAARPSPTLEPIA